MRIKIANKLMVYFLAVSILPLAIAGFIAYRQASDALRDTKLERLEVLAQERVNRLERLFRERKGDAAQAKHEGLLSAFVDAERVHDMLLIGPGGDVVFTLSKERTWARTCAPAGYRS